jgi:hypothetical protein
MCVGEKQLIEEKPGLARLEMLTQLPAAVAPKY